MTRRFRGPISSAGSGEAMRWTLRLDDDELEVIARLLRELRELLESGTDDGPVPPLLQRLFPTAYPDDEEKDAEYQRLMRGELVTSRIHQIDAVSRLLGVDADEGPRRRTLDEGEVIALMQSVNAVRIVLGTMLDIGEDDIDVDDEHPAAAEHHLYGYLSWLLEWIVRSMRGTTPN
ncbi:MAG: DUF2017 family protein [Ilumatobacter sp.]